MADVKWLLCPVCGQKTRNKLRMDTVLENYPLFCPKCKRESLVQVRNQKVHIVIEPVVKTQSY